MAKKRPGRQAWDSIEDKTKADFSEQTMNSYNVRKKFKSPIPLSYKEPMKWQHDDLTDIQNSKVIANRPQNRVAGKGLVTDNLARAKNRKLNTKPQKKLLPFLEPSFVKKYYDNAKKKKKISETVLGKTK